MGAMRAAWIDFYDAEYPLVIRFVMKTGPAHLDDARDAAQDAFLDSWTLMTTQPDYWSTINQRGWIRTMALRRYRRPPGPRRRVPVELVEDGAVILDRPAPGADSGEVTAQAHTVLHALAGLDPGMREVMALLTDGFTTRAIAEQLDMTGQKVQDLARTARARLRRDLAAATTTEWRQSR